MVSGLFLLLACVALVVAVFWVVANEGAGVDGPTRGLLALPHEARQEAQKARSGQGPSVEQAGADEGAGPRRR